MGTKLVDVWRSVLRANHVGHQALVTHGLWQGNHNCLTDTWLQKQDRLNLFKFDSVTTDFHLKIRPADKL